MRSTGQRYVRSFSPSLPPTFSPFVPFSRHIGRPPKYNAVLGFGALTPTSPPSSHPDSPENEKTETTFTFPAPVQPVSLPSPTSTDVSNGRAHCLSELPWGNLSCVVSSSGITLPHVGSRDPDRTLCREGSSAGAQVLLCPWDSC